MRLVLKELRMKVLKKQLLAAASFEDKVDTVALAFAANKEVTLGLDYSKMERSGTAITVKGPDTKVYHAVVAYNLGPVVVSAMYEDAKTKQTLTWQRYLAKIVL